MRLRTFSTLLPVLLGLCCMSAAWGQPRVQVDGHVWSGATPLCALVLANGQSMFSCGPDGPFSLQAVPLDGNGQIDVQVFVSGFAPFRQTVTPTGASSLATLPQVNMIRVENGRTFQVTEQYVPLLAENKVRVSGSVSSEGTLVCGLILANGQKMFSCQENLGAFSLDVPLDADGNVTLMVFAAGFEPYRTVTPVDLGSQPTGGECLDLGGTWRVTENVQLTCRLGNESESLNESATATGFMEQDGCNIRIIEPITGTPRTGTIDGNRVTLSGQFIIPTPEVSVSENVITFEQVVLDVNDFTMIGTGLYIGTLDGSQFRCDGETTSRFVRP